jgi:chemotaxis signal transduction protein/nucleoid-associated protein YgaU
MAGGIPKSEASRAPRTWLVFAVGPYAMCASALDVEGIIQRPGAIARLPSMPDYALGAFVFRGRSAAAISLRRKLKLPDAHTARVAPFIVARIGASIAAFCVDEVRDVVDDKNFEWRELPGLLAESPFERIAVHGDALILQTTFASLRDARVEFASLFGWAAAQPATELPRKEQEFRAAAVEQARKSSALQSDPMPPQPLPQPVSSKSEHRARPAVLSAVPPRVAPRASERTSAAKQAVVAMPVKEWPASPARQEPVSQESVVQSAAISQGARSPFAAAAIAAALVTCIGVVASASYYLVPAPGRQAPPVSIATATAQSPSVAAPAVSAPSEPAVVVTIERNSTKARETLATVTHIHTVVPGDTLWRIAKKQVGDPYRYPELARLSNIRNPDVIRPGDVVRIEIRNEK